MYIVSLNNNLEGTMATEKTPAHKRISRAESSATQWKVKAIERREENEALREQLKTTQENAKVKSVELDEADKCQMSLKKHIAALTEQLEKVNRTNSRLQTEVDELKKKSFR